MLDLPERGEIRVDDTEYAFPVTSHDRPVKPWPRISAVLQDVYLWPHLTVRKNLSLSLRNLDATQRQQSVSNMIESFGLESIQGQLAGRISGGERQRVAIARALLLQTRYLFLDEPTSSLDIRSISILSTLLRELASHGVGVIIVSHLFGFLRETARRIVYIENGRIVESGGIHLLESPGTSQMKEFIACM
jgi:arginine transport system ATP-binding protein